MNGTGGTAATPRGDGASPAPWPVMVLAHNEERSIAACLDSIFAAADGAGAEVFVMANGCTDRTERIVRDYSRAGVQLVSIPVGDKCNAWNVFVHDTVAGCCPGREAYFFMNGDVTVAKGSFAALARALREEPQAHAASAVPVGGRNAERYRRQILKTHGLVANLYALRGAFIDRLRALAVRLPLNFEGDDGLIGYLVKCDLAPELNPPDDRRIAPRAAAGFAFESLSALRPADWKAYWKRLVRYGRSGYEFKLLGPLLKSRGIAGLPADITELYGGAAALPLDWNGIYTLPNWIALRQMRNSPARGR